MLEEVDCLSSDTDVEGGWLLDNTSPAPLLLLHQLPEICVMLIKPSKSAFSSLKMSWVAIIINIRVVPMN